jgi:hypothetical protein
MGLCIFCNSNLVLTNIGLICLKCYGKNEKLTKDEIDFLANSMLNQYNAIKA